MTKHIYGPWEVREFKHSIGICHPDIKDNYQARVAEMPIWNTNKGAKGEPYKDLLAYAHLIAAAPDLLETLESRPKHCHYMDDDGAFDIDKYLDDLNVWATKSRAVIAKATGQEPQSQS